MQASEHLLPGQPNRTVVLIAEDEVMVMNLARIVLEAEGYVVLTAGDGEQALHLSRQYPGTIHALLSDVKMPRLNGLELRKQLLVERPGMRVLLMSGHLQVPSENIPFLRKPFGRTVLKERMHDLLASTATA